MNKNDLRYIKTEELIRDAFLSCACEHSIEDIHIKDICAKARISRNAFYGHYETKYELLEQIYRDVEKKILYGLKPEMIRDLANRDMFGITQWCIRAIDDHKALLRILSGSSRDRFRELIHKVFIDATLSAVYEGTGAIRQDMALRMSEAYITDGLTSIILIWLREPGQIGREELTHLLYEITRHSVEFFYSRIEENQNIERR